MQTGIKTINIERIEPNSPLHYFLRSLKLSILIHTYRTAMSASGNNNNSGGTSAGGVSNEVVTIASLNMSSLNFPPLTGTLRGPTIRCIRKQLCVA